jgi:uncharacterized protein YdeI (YjbR/CyaY-like superfamily)
LSSDPSILEFPNQTAWEAWLHANHANSSGTWVRLAKKSSGARSLAYAEALESALCYGWIDAQKKAETSIAWLQRFTPRGAKSIWSKINRQKALALIDSGRMQPAGLLEIERARKDGRYEAAYDSPRTATVPADLQVALDQSPGAKAFFATLNSANRYAILFRLQTAKKPETRARRILRFIAMLENHETFH